jgi:hypothetical protein
VFRVVAPPIVSAVCHCLGCQRMSSSAFSLTLMVAAQGVEIVSGALVPGGMRAADLRHEFCDDCKTWVLARVEQLGVVNVRPTLLDDARWFVPYLETYVETQLPWATTPAVKRYDRFPPPESYPELMADFAAWARARGWPTA